MISENKEKKGGIFIWIAIILFIILVIVIVVFGVSGIFKIIGTIFSISMFIGLLMAVAYLFYYLFIKKHRFDVTYVNKQKLIEAGKINAQASLMHELYVSGDAGHSRAKIGKIIGYDRIQILVRNQLYHDQDDLKKKIKKGDPVMVKDKETSNMMPAYTIGHEEQDVFIVKKGLGIFSDPMVIRVSPRDHDELVGDVTLKGFSILPLSEYWFLNSDYLDVRKIDYAILKEAERGIMFEGLRDMKEIVDKAVGLDSSHKKGLEQKNLYDVPEQKGDMGR